MASRRPTSSTGDLQNNLEKLRYELQHSKYTGPIDIRILRKGSPADLLPLVHFALLGLSRLLHDELVAKGYDLFAKTDIRFMEAAFKLLRNEFDYQPALRVDQFFSDGFVERKIILVHDVIKLCQIRGIDLRRGKGGKGPIAACGEGRQARGVKQAPSAAPLVERHSSRRVSISSENDADVVPRPAAPTPLHASILHRNYDQSDDGGPASSDFFMPPLDLHLSEDGGVPVLMGDPRSRSNPHNISGENSGENAKLLRHDDIDEEDYDSGYVHGVVQTSDAYERFRRRACQDGGGVAELDGDDGDQDDLFVPRDELAQRQQHVSGHACHNDALVLRMSESMLVFVTRVEDLEAKLGVLEGHAMASDDMLKYAHKEKEEVEARLVLAEGRIRMLEQRVNEMACDAAVTKVFRTSPEHSSQQKSYRPQLESPHQIASAHTDTMLNASGGSESGQRGGSPNNTFRPPSQQPSPGKRMTQASYYTTTLPPSAASELKQSGQSGHSEGGDELQSFIASITGRFKETNELLAQSKETLRLRQTPT